MPTRCRVTDQGRPCSRPATHIMDTGDLGRVPMCDAHYADVDARIQQQIEEWARQLAEGAALDDLTLLPPRRGF